MGTCQTLSRFQRVINSARALHWPPWYFSTSQNITLMWGLTMFSFLFVIRNNAIALRQRQIVVLSHRISARWCHPIRPSAKRLLTLNKACVDYIYPQVCNIIQLRLVMGSSTHLHESIRLNRLFQRTDEKRFSNSFTSWRNASSRRASIPIPI